MPSCNYLFKNGKPAIFINHEYLTDIAAEVEELDAEIKLGHPHISRDPLKKEVDDTKLDPLAAVKAQAIKEYLAQQAATAGTQDMGNSVQGPVVVNNSQNIASATTDTSAVARLKQLNIKPS